MISDAHLLDSILDGPYERALRQAAIDNAFFLATLETVPEDQVVDAEPVSEVER
jgi:hypothetical protein